LVPQNGASSGYCPINRASRFCRISKNQGVAKLARFFHICECHAGDRPVDRKKEML
jgi:hypothetical protein